MRPVTKSRTTAVHRSIADCFRICISLVSLLTQHHKIPGHGWLVIRAVEAEDPCPGGGECDSSGLIHLHDDVGGAVQGAGYREGLVLPSVDDRVKCVRRV